jgi:hypothetical protein
MQSTSAKDNFQARIIASIGDKPLWKLRSTTAINTGRGLAAAGVLLYSSANPRPQDKAVIAVSILLQMAGELILASATLLTTGSHYAGAALVRQIVEIEYLTWTFKEKRRNPAEWLDSTAEERMKAFTPSQLRKTSQGRFLYEDYSNHCEQGGHPVPRGAALLRGSNLDGAQILLADLITHSWRTWDQVVVWAEDVPRANPIISASIPRIYPRLREWGKVDPLYALMLETRPNPDLQSKNMSGHRG